MFYASLKIRIYAFLLDYLVIILYAVFTLGTISFLFKSYMNRLFTSSPVIAELTGFFMITLPVSLYFIYLECSKGQGTWGKRKMGLRVVDNNGQRIGIGRSVFRNAIKFFPWEAAHFGIWRLRLPSDLTEKTILTILCASILLTIIYVIIPLTNNKGKSVYDWITGTAVVHLNRK